MTANVFCTFSSANSNLWLNLTMGEIQFVNFPDGVFAYFFFCFKIVLNFAFWFWEIKK